MQQDFASIPDEIRWERRAENYQALVEMACALIAYRVAARRNGHAF
jgi:hypothetical protein